MTNDAYRTLFQLKEYHLLQDLYVFVETELLQQVQDQSEPGKEIRKRKSDILCFALVSKPSNDEDVNGFVWPIALPVNSNAKALVEKCKFLMDRKMPDGAKMSFQLSGLEFNEDNIPENLIVESGSVLKVKVEKVDMKGEKNNLILLISKLASYNLIVSSVDGKKDLNNSKRRLKLQRKKEKQDDKKSSGKSKPFTLGFVRI